MQILFSDVDVVSDGVMSCVIITFILIARSPVDMKMSLFASIF